MLDSIGLIPRDEGQNTVEDIAVLSKIRDYMEADTRQRYSDLGVPGPESVYHSLQHTEEVVEMSRITCGDSDLRRAFGLHAELAKYNAMMSPNVNSVSSIALSPQQIEGVKKHSDDLKIHPTELGLMFEIAFWRHDYANWVEAWNLQRKGSIRTIAGSRIPPVHMERNAEIVSAKSAEVGIFETIRSIPGITDTQLNRILNRTQAFVEYVAELTIVEHDETDLSHRLAFAEFVKADDRVASYLNKTPLEVIQLNRNLALEKAERRGQANKKDRTRLTPNQVLNYPLNLMRQYYPNNYEEIFRLLEVKHQKKMYPGITSVSQDADTRMPWPAIYQFLSNPNNTYKVGPT